jgi:hypothetical protein
MPLFLLRCKPFCLHIAFRWFYALVTMPRGFGGPLPISPLTSPHRGDCGGNRHAPTPPWHGAVDSGNAKVVLPALP